VESIEQLHHHHPPAPVFLDEKATWPTFHSIRREYKMYEGPKEIQKKET
jgi:hypothetical protein